MKNFDSKQVSSQFVGETLWSVSDRATIGHGQETGHSFTPEY